MTTDVFKKEERNLRRSTVGALIKLARTKAGLTQLQVAKKLGYTSPQFVSNWERGDSLPPMEIFPKLATLLHIDSKELIECIHRYQEIYLVIEKRKIVDLFQNWRGPARRR